MRATEGRRCVCNAVVLAAACLTASAYARSQQTTPPTQTVPPAAQGGPSTPSAQLALEALDSCRARLDPRIDIGFDRIAARCPQLGNLLRRSEWSEWLPEDWQEPANNLSSASLSDLRVLIARELSVAPSGRTPRVERLHDVLAELGHAEPQRSGLWTRFKAWLRRVFDSPDNARDPGWLGRLIDRGGLSQTMIALITYGGLAAVILLAIVIVVNELREAGVLAALRRGRRMAARDAGNTHALSTPLDIDAAPLVEQPGLLLELVVDRLARQEKLPAPRSLTHAELSKVANLANTEDRRRFDQLVATAERVRYAQEAAEPDILHSAIAAGRELLASLAASARTVAA